MNLAGRYPSPYFGDEGGDFGFGFPSPRKEPLRNHNLKGFIMNARQARIAALRNQVAAPSASTIKDKADVVGVLSGEVLNTVPVFFTAMYETLLERHLERKVAAKPE